METFLTILLIALAQLGSRHAVASPESAPILLQSNDPSREIEFFSGEVVEVSSDRIEVVRSALGKNDSRRFSINDETKFEGTPKKGSRVTVGYYAKSSDVAIRIIVRESED